MANHRSSADFSRGEFCSETQSPEVNEERSRQILKHDRGQEGPIPSSSDSYASKTLSPDDSDFLFINVNDKSANGRHCDESRMLVRSHVMNTFYRKKSSPQSKDEIPAKKSESRGTTSKFRINAFLSDRKVRRQNQKSSPVCNKDDPEATVSIPQYPLGEGSIEPFAAGSIPWDSHLQDLIQHYASDMPNSTDPMKYSIDHVQNFVLKLGIADEALLQAILAYSMIHQFCFGTSSMPSNCEKIVFVTTNHEVLNYRTQALHLVNKRLGSCDVSDATVATVLVLLWHHPWIQEGGADEAQIHLAGLKHMVEYRGGLEKLAEPLSNAILFWASQLTPCSSGSLI